MNKSRLVFLKNYILPVLFLLFEYICDIWFLLKYGLTLLDSDMASEMILSDILNKTHSIVTADWIYSTEIRVFETQWFYRIGLLMSPDNWHIARVIAMALMLAVLALSAFLFGRVAGLKQSAIWLAGLSLCPLGAWYFFHTIFGGYYIPYIVFSLLSLYFILSIYKAKNSKNSILHYVLLGIVAIASGLNGIRQFMVFFAPLLVAAAFLMIRYKISIIRPTIYSASLNLIGYGINMTVLAKKFKFLTHDHYSWGGGTDNWLLTFKSYFESFGFRQICEVEGLEFNYSIPLFSYKGIFTGCGLMIGILVFLSLLYLVLRINKLSELDKIIVTVICSMLFVMGFIFTYIQFDQRFWQPTIIFGFVILLLFIKNFDYQQLAIIGSRFTKEIVALSLTAVIVVFAVLSSIGTMKNCIDYPLRAQPNLSSVINWIIENTDYELGIADFWQSNIVTELTNGDIEMYTVIKLDDRVELYRWLQKNEHEQSFPPQRYFVIVTHDQDLEAYDYLIHDFDNERIYEDTDYIVFGVN